MAASLSLPFERGFGMQGRKDERDRHFFGYM